MKWGVLITCASLATLMAGPAFSADRPVIGVSPGGLVPDKIGVHVGEVVQWQAAGVVGIRIEFDSHRGAHELVERSGEIRAVFIRPGEHWYVASIAGNSHRQVRGVVVVREADGPASLPPICAPPSSGQICFEP